jgi:hypothetical protein
VAADGHLGPPAAFRKKPKARILVSSRPGAPKRAVYVLEKLRPARAERGDGKATNLRTQFERIIKRAGLTEGPRLWHNMRASRQTEWVEKFPAHVVSAWLGNTERVAEKDYLQVLESHFERAAQKTAHSESESTRIEANQGPTNEKPLVSKGFLSNSWAVLDSNQ